MVLVASESHTTTSASEPTAIRPCQHSSYSASSYHRQLHRVPEKSIRHFYLCDNFGKSGLIFIILHCQIQKGSAEEASIKIKTITFPQICCRATLRNVGPKWSIYSAANSVKSDAKTFNYSKYSRECYFSVRLYHMCLKCLHSSRIRAWSRASHWSMDASIACRSMLC